MCHDSCPLVRTDTRDEPNSESVPSLTSSQSRVPADRSCAQKQGILPLWLLDKSAYSQISSLDRVQTIGLTSVLDSTAIDDRIKLRVIKPSGEVVEVECRHTLSSDQVEWLRAGTALNWIGEQARRRAPAEGVF